jgi:hypothetical protein
MEATVKQDFATLESSIADDLIDTHSTARIDTKERLISTMKSGHTVSTGLEAPGVVAQDLGSAARSGGWAEPADSTRPRSNRA